MFKHVKIVTFLLVILIFLNEFASADNATYCNHTYSIYYSPITLKIYLACAGSADTLDLITIDPLTALEERSFEVFGLVQAVIPVDDGDNLLLLLAEVDGDPLTHDGALRKVNAQTGDLISGFEVSFDETPLAMVADNMQNYAYISYGLSSFDEAKIIKISLLDFRIFPNTVSYGENPNNLALTNDDLKLYVKNEQLFEEFKPSGYSVGTRIGVINTIDMSINTEINVPFGIMTDSIIMGYDNRLFISNAIPMVETDSDISLLIVDTTIDEIIGEIILEEDGIGDIGIDPINKTLYGIIWPRDNYDPEMEEMIHHSSHKFFQFDLTDSTYPYSVFSLGSEGLWEFVLATIPGNKKLFATAEHSEEIYFMDVK